MKLLKLNFEINDIKTESLHFAILNGYLYCEDYYDYKRLYFMKNIKMKL